MKKCIIIGGGFAGLSSAAYLSKAGIKINILEASPKLGGRAYSLKDSSTGSVIDNGQHILMGCYKYTLDFLKEIGAEENLKRQEYLQINFVKENFQIYPLSAPGNFYPINLLVAVCKYKAFSIDDKIRFISFFSKIPFYSYRDLEKMTVNDWLEKENQSENSKKAFWEILAIGALNTNIHKASAKIFADILKEIFFKGNKAATILIPKFGLTETYCHNASEFIVRNGGEIINGETVNEFKIFENKITSVITSKREIKDFDYIISTVPFYAFKKIIENSRIILSKTSHKKLPPDLNMILNLNFDYSSILSIHIWLKKNPLKNSFYGLIDSPVHWVFNHDEHITLVISDADDLILKTKEEIYDLAVQELEKYLLIKKELISSYKIIKEKRATFIPSKEILNKRPTTETTLENLYLAGDWVDTGLPSTIESAVKSGKMAADILLSKNS